MPTFNRLNQQVIAIVLTKNITLVRLTLFADLAIFLEEYIIFHKLFQLLFFIVLLSIHAVTLAQSTQVQANKANIDIPKISGSITIDANLNEPQWQQAKKVTMNIVTRPYNNTASTFNTEALLMEDGGVFYLAFIADDPNPSEIRAFLKDRDRSWGEDMIGIKIDTYNTQRTAYRFLVNPLGVQNDGVESEVTKSESNAWDGIWQSAGKITEKGYIVEMALPLRMLNFNEQEGIQHWGIELVRFYPRDIFLRLSNITLDRGNSCEICQLALATGFKGAKQGDNLIITPSLVGNAIDTKNDTDDWDKETNVEASLDVRWGITPDWLLNATINPDFSTVETDGARLNINNNFALFYQEKRPFFLDNADYFDTNYNVVYTRNINAPNYGTKLTGREGKHSFGLFLTDDKSTNILVPGNRASSIATIDGESKGAAFRYRNDYNEDITLGWISTLRSAQNYQNFVNGIDGKIKLNTENIIKFQYLFSDTEYPDDFFAQFCNSDNPQDCTTPEAEENCDLESCNYNESVLRTLNADSFTGNAFKVDYSHVDSQWYYFVKYRQQDAGFRGDLGFIPRVDFNKFITGAERRWYAEQGNWWTKFKIYSDYDITHNDKGDLIEEEYEVNAQLNATYNSYFRLSYVTRDKVGSRIDKSSLAIEDNTTLFNESRFALFAEFKPFLNLYLGGFISYGDAIDFSSNRLGQRTEISPTINWNVNRHFELKLRHTFSQLDADDNNGVNANVYIARLTDLRATYQFNVNSFLRFTLIYNNTSQNPNNYLYIPPEDITADSKDFSSELLYAYKINPQTVFYLGYSDHQASENSFSQLNKDLRSAFVKFSYAWIK